MTPVASDGPSFCTAMEYRSPPANEGGAPPSLILVSPATTEIGPDFATVTSAERVTSTSASAVLGVPGVALGSVGDVTSAVLVSVAGGVADENEPTTITVSMLPAPMVPRSHGKDVAVVQVPVEGVIESTTKPAGSESSTLTSRASEGPPFETAIV